MTKETTVARERGVGSLNAENVTSSLQRNVRVTQKRMDSIAQSFNDSDTSDKYIDGLKYDRGTVTAYTTEKGYGDRRPYREEYTKTPDRSEKGWRWDDRDAFAEEMFKRLKREGIKVKKLIHHGQYD